MLVRVCIPIRGVAQGIGRASDVEGHVLTVDLGACILVNVYASDSHRIVMRVAEKLAFLDALDAFVAGLQALCRMEAD